MTFKHVTIAHFTEMQPFSSPYTNYRGEQSIRQLFPHSLWWGSTKWHPEPGLMLRGFDLVKGDDRDFALKDFDFTRFQKGIRL